MCTWGWKATARRKMWHPAALLPLLLGALATLALPLHAQPNHQHIPIIPDDLIPTHTTITYTTSTRHTQHATLAYLTPWNRGGYDVALNYTSRFTHLSPVWFQVKLVSRPSKQHDNRHSLAVLVTGQHDVDEQWMEAVRTADPGVRVVPRFIVEMTCGAPGEAHQDG